MSDRLNEEKYLLLLQRIKAIYAADVDGKLKYRTNSAFYGNVKIKGVCFSNDYRILSIDAYQKHKGSFAPGEEQTLLLLNLIIPDNERFARIFLNLCETYFKTNDIYKIIFLYMRKKYYANDTWNEILEKLEDIFFVPTSQINDKIIEILKFPHIYFDDYNKEPIK